MRFDATFQCHDAVVGMYIDAIGVDLIALIEPVRNRGFQRIAIDAIRGQRGAAVRAVSSSGLGRVDENGGVGLFVKIRRGGTISIFDFPAWPR